MNLRLRANIQFGHDVTDFNILLIGSLDENKTCGTGVTIQYFPLHFPPVNVWLNEALPTRGKLGYPSL